MYIAQSKRKENIAEYILYLWQLEDLLRALQFSPEAVYSQLVQKQERLSEQQKQQALVWYMELAGLLREEGKEQSGHLEHTMHLIADLDNLHRQLLTLPAGGSSRPNCRDSRASSASPACRMSNCSSARFMP